MPWKQRPTESNIMQIQEEWLLTTNVLSFHNEQNLSYAKYGEQICSLKRGLVLSDDTGSILLLKHTNILSSSSTTSPMATDTILTHKAVCLKNPKPLRDSVTLRESQELAWSDFIRGKLKFKDISASSKSCLFWGHR